MSLAKNIKWEMHIRMVYSIATFIENVFQYQMDISAMQKPQLLLHQPNKFHNIYWKV